MNAHTDTDLVPFRVDIPEADLADLHERLDRTRWPDPIPGRDDRTDFSRGIPNAYLRELADAWRTFDWREQEAALNEHEQYTTVVDGQTFHVVRVRSANPDATPLMLVHGWPGSFVEYQRLIPLLTDEFDLVMPSLPGFGFSNPLSSTGWELARTTEAFAEIMTRLGYDRFGVHGTDIGAGIAGRLAALYPDRVTGVHVGSDGNSLAMVGDQFPYPDGLTDEEKDEIAAIREREAADRGYFDLQNHKPDTIGPALVDSPVGQLAWIAEKFQGWTDPTRPTPDEAVDRDQLLTDISLYWFTKSGASSAQFYWESTHSGLDWLAGGDVPTAWSVFDTHPLMAKAFNAWGGIAQWREHESGGHFPAMEQPELLADDLREFFAGLRA
ncbi:epoxide hydrolase family protein [Agromyces sp. LHK192]|uniref:epoxide hydrolase family protein n=1 Tax=Agromyces sp. LHK192 TaxID=2498704 RepID=UPI000FDBF7A2|nr:epoxide hydrolase family protein [Agromyces sp. LHK192]